MQSIINSKGTTAVRTATAGLFAGIMSPARPWSSFSIVDDPELIEFGPVKFWIDDTEHKMRRIFNASNLYNMAPVMLEELLLFATGCMLEEEDFKTFKRFYTQTVGSYMIAQDAKLRVNTVVREYEIVLNAIAKAEGNHEND